jgi:hypothetical protein
LNENVWNAQWVGVAHLAGGQEDIAAIEEVVASVG